MVQEVIKKPNIKTTIRSFFTLAPFSFPAYLIIKNTLKNRTATVSNANKTPISMSKVAFVIPVILENIISHTFPYNFLFYIIANKKQNSNIIEVLFENKEKIN